MRTSVGQGTILFTQPVQKKNRFSVFTHFDNTCATSPIIEAIDEIFNAMVSFPVLMGALCAITGPARVGGPAGKCAGDR